MTVKEKMAKAIKAFNKQVVLATNKSNRGDAEVDLDFAGKCSQPGCNCRIVAFKVNFKPNSGESEYDFEKSVRSLVHDAAKRTANLLAFNISYYMDHTDFGMQYGQGPGGELVHSDLLCNVEFTIRPI